MKWFGKPWDATVCEGERVETPVDAVCFGSCGEPIDVDDRGVVLPFLGFKGSDANPVPEVPYHLACFVDSILGTK